MILAKRVVALAAALGAAYLAVHLGLADRRLVRQETATAGRLDGFNSEEAVAMADRALQRERPQEAERLARIAVGRSPLNADALELLAMAREDQGGDAGKVLQAAAALGWRSVYAQLWSMDADVERDDFARAIVRGDALLRQGVREEEVIALLRRMSDRPQPRAALVARLSAEPAWRRQYLTDLRGLPGQSFSAHEAVLDQLRVGPAPAKSEEVNAYLAHLQSTGQFARARAIWRRFDARAEAALVSDAYFARIPKPDATAAPFAWRFHQVTGAELEAGEQDDTGRGSLRVRADGAATGRALEQVLVAPGGTYDLSFEARERVSGSINRVEWKVSCLGGSGKVEVEPQRPVRESTGWSRWAQQVRIPRQNCPGQSLELWIYQTGVEDIDVAFRQVRLGPVRQS